MSLPISTTEEEIRLAALASLDGYRPVNPDLRPIPAEAVADLSDDEVEFQAEMDLKLRNRRGLAFGEARDR